MCVCVCVYILIWSKVEIQEVEVVIYEGLYFDLAQGQMNGAPNETRGWSIQYEGSILTVIDVLLIWH